MHAQARDAFARMLRAVGDRGGLESVYRVLDLGGADVNGTVHRMLPSDAIIDVLDIDDGPGVTIIADARTYRSPSLRYDMVISTELLEHVDGWEAVIRTALLNIRPGGWFIGTAASVGRPEHGARGNRKPAPGEHYANVLAGDLRRELGRPGPKRESFGGISVGYLPVPGDVHWRARRDV